MLSNVNPEYVNLTHSILQLDSGDTAMNMSLYYAADIVKSIMLIEFNVQKDKTDRNYEKELIKSSTNICKMVQGVFGNFVTKMIMEDLNKFIDFDLTCPFKKVSFFFGH